MHFDPDPLDQRLLAQQDAILASDPDDVTANCNKGMILLDLCGSEEALECFERALQRDPSHARSWIGKGRALTMQEDYAGAEKCFYMVPKDDGSYGEAQNQSARNRRYRDRRGRAQASVETNDEKKFNDELEQWMDQHLDDIQNLQVLLHKLRCARDGHRRKVGNVFHAWLVRQFYELGGPLKVLAVECNDIEPNTDVDIVLSGDVYVQVWHGKAPLGYTMDDNMWSGENTPLDMDWCEELKPIEKKLRQLPSNTGKGFVVNFAPGGPVMLHSTLHKLCSERQCVMMMGASNHHVVGLGASDFKHRSEACLIARALGRPLKLILGDWNELGKQGRNPMYEMAYGHNPYKPPHIDLHLMRGSKQDLLNYARDTLNHPSCDDLAKMGREELYLHLCRIQLHKDSDCEDEPAPPP